MSFLFKKKKKKSESKSEKKSDGKESRAAQEVIALRKHFGSMKMSKKKFEIGTTLGTGMACTSKCLNECLNA